jgi:hypothetical protein
MNYFNQENYIKIIKKFIKLKYDFVNFSNFIKKKNQIILRHDIDFSPTAALKIAKIDHKLKVKSYFFFLIQNKYYNIRENKNLKILLKIKNLGHEIGLHFNNSSKFNYKNKQKFHKEIKILEKILHEKINVFSFHKPGKYKKIPTKNKIFYKTNAYGKRYFKDCLYISDSTGKWRYGHPLKNLKIIKQKKSLQLLMHPIWWHKIKKINEKDTGKILLEFKKNYE